VEHDMTSEAIRIAIVGAGGIANMHAGGVTNATGAELIAVCDLDESKARELAEKYRIPRWYTDFDALLKSETLDGVVICSSHASHYPLVLRCAEAKLHVLVEKPLSSKLSEAERMVQVARDAGIKLGAVFQRRFQPAAQRLRAAIESGRNGKVTLIECLNYLERDKAYFDLAEWRGTWAMEGGGALMTQAIHMLDMVHWLAGNPVEVYGRWDTSKHRSYSEVEDTVVATIAFESGTLGTLTACTTLKKPHGFSVIARCLNGASLGYLEDPELSEAKTHLWTSADGPDPREPWELTDETRPGMPRFHHIQIQDFVDALQHDREPAVTGKDALVSLHMAKAVYLSDYRRAPVKLPLTADDIAELEANAERPRQI